MRVPELRNRNPRFGNAVTRALGRILLSLLGWRIHGEIPNLSKCVIACAPHTSHWDFVIGETAIVAMGLKAQWLASERAFRWPFGTFTRWLGGHPVGRVKTIVAEFNSRHALIIAIWPEGTRERREKWKTGFYYIAHGADVPLVLVSFDFGKKIMTIGPTLVTTGDIAVDMVEIVSFFNGTVAKKPEQFRLPT